MRKNKHAVICVIFMSAFAFSVLTSIPVKAYDYSGYESGSAVNLYTTNWCQFINATYDEAQTSSDTLSYIYGRFADQATYIYNSGTDEWDYQPTYVKDQNWGYSLGGYSSTAGLVQANIAESNGASIGFSTDLYVGHGSLGHFYGYQSNSSAVDDSLNPPTSNFVHNSDVSSASPQKENFVFLWVCNNAIWMYDMPSAWSGDNIISNNDGYTSPDYSEYAFIGFTGASPWLYEKFASGNTYGSWLESFYYAALSGSTTINEALDMASWYTNGNWGTFANSTLYTGFHTWWPYNDGMGGDYSNNHMVIYGDGTMTLPTTVYIG